MQRIIQWGRLLGSLSRNSALAAVRFPLSMLLTGSGLLLVSLLPVLITHQLGEAGRLVRDSALSLHLVLGIVLALFLAGSLSRDADARSEVPLILSKPVSRQVYFFSVFIGMLVMEMIFSVCMTASACLALAAASESFVVHWQWLGPLMLILVGSFAAGGWLNYRKHWNFCSTTLCLLMPSLLAAGIVLAVLLPDSDRGLIDHCFRAGLLTAMALVVFLGLSVGTALAFGFPAAVSVCCVGLVLGLLADYFMYGADNAGQLTRVLWNTIPNWQRFWMEREGAVSWRYLGMAAGYACSYVGFVLWVCAGYFRRSELRG